MLWLTSPTWLGMEHAPHCGLIPGRIVPCTPICTDKKDPIIQDLTLLQRSQLLLLKLDGVFLDQTIIMIVWRQNFRHSTPFNRKPDAIRWNGKSMKTLHVTDIWEVIRIEGHQVPWADSVWHKLSIPGYSFLHWLIMHGRLSTLDRLLHFGVVDNSTCYFCISGRENHNHLFLECSLSQQPVQENFGIDFPYHLGRLVTRVRIISKAGH